MKPTDALNEHEETMYRLRQMEIDREYQRHLDELELEKKRFFADNPDFPKEYADLMFLNVIAPRKNYRIVYVE